MTGKKFDAGKSPIVQGCMHYFPQALLAVGKVSEYGAKKYGVPYSDKNWLDVENAIDRYADGLGRHLISEDIEGMHDGESFILHAAHAAWNALARLELLLRAGHSLQVVTPKAPVDDIPF